MSDWGRIHREFWQHPKAERVGLAAVGLWTICVSYSKYHRSAGLIAFDCELLEGQQGSVDALVKERLWHKVEEGYQFNDWEVWNSDEHPKTTAAKLVNDVLPHGHPTNVRHKLSVETATLLEDGIEYGVVKAALKLWLGKSNAAPSWLPYLVSDVARKGGGGERDSALREAWRTGDVKPLVKYGLVFTPPDLPADVTTVDEAKAFMKLAKRAWLVDVRKEL